MAEAKVFGIIALKGGVGKTTTVVNLGAALTQEYNKRILLVDANFSTPHLGLHLGLLNPEKHLQHVLENKYSIYEAIYQHPIGFHILPGAISSKSIDPLALKEKLAPLKEIYDIILIDSSPSLNDEMFATMAASDELLVVSSPDYPTLSSTLHAISIAKKRNTPIRGIVINKIRGKKFELSSLDIAKASDIKVLATLSDDYKVQAALAEMIPVVSKTPNISISQDYKKLAGILAEEPYSKGYRVIKKIKEKLNKFKKHSNKEEK